jgi:hypothetical protein
MPPGPVLEEADDAFEDDVEDRNVFSVPGQDRALDVHDLGHKRLRGGRGRAADAQKQLPEHLWH